ncbi:MAG: glutamine-hydrolyzing carbamoyl-phosphate synthase small subunit, partial [Dehalococcoidia bacterium]|nr:glutamine-hydrolyzing carbamoyl-phosphate synthase small subunit [Dehalococcoidia bacterium]
MNKKAFLVLEDGSAYEGYSYGADVSTHGEVVFNTSMTGYQEMLTDPSYAGQIVVPTYPLIGNYGVNSDDAQSNRIQVAGFVVREECHLPSHWNSRSTLHEYLLSSGIPGIVGVDTRAITRRLRVAGVMMGMITSEPPEEALQQFSKMPRYDDIDFVQQVSTDTVYRWNCAAGLDAPYHIVVVDCGLKFSILRYLCQLGCNCTVVPSTTSAEDILNLKPDGIVLSPGPGDPNLPYLEKTVCGLLGKKPIMGICLGHQLIARAFGGKTYKLKFGHRGANHPVRDLESGKVHITAQNHGFAVDADSLKGGLEVSHINLNDGTVEG